MSQASQVEGEISQHLDACNYEQAATAMVRAYGSEIFGYLLGASRDLAFADEVFSTVTEDLWRGLPAFRRESSARTWLYRLAYHALQRHRKDPYRKRQKRLTAELDHAVEQVRSQTAGFLRTNIKDAVRDLRQKLSDEEQTLLILKVDRDLSWREVAAIMGSEETPLSEATLAKRYQRVREKLRRLAVEAGLLS